MMAKNLKRFYKKHKNAFIRARLYTTFLLVGIASVARGFEWILFIAIIPMISYLPYIHVLPKKVVLRDFYWSSFITCGFAYFFLFQMAPQNWSVALTGWFAIVSRGVAWTLVSFFCSLSFLVIGVILLKIKRFRYQLLVLPFLWILGEVLRTYLYAIMAYGPGGSISPNFNWGSIAAIASGTPLVYSSRLGGFYGLAFLMVIINIAIFLLFGMKRYFIATTLLLGVCLITFVGWKQGAGVKDREINIALVHLNEATSVEFMPNIKMPASKVDLMVLPEYSGLFKNEEKEKLTSTLKEAGIGVTTQETGTSPEGTNQVVYFNHKAEKVSKQDKTFLIPTGEYMPYSLQFAFFAIAQDSVLSEFKYSQQIMRGARPESPYDNGTISVGALACSGVNALNEYRRLKNEGADILVNSASLAFLTNKSLYHVYAYNMARFQAVSNNRPFVQASRSGESYILDNQGRAVVQHKGNETKLLEAKLQF